MPTCLPSLEEVRLLARRLSDQQPLAVDVWAIIQMRGIEVRRDVAPGDPKAFVSFARPAPTIYLGERFGGSAFERYVLAHELGHIAIDTAYGLRPTRGDYWDHERLCDEFAAELLVPGDFLKRIGVANMSASTGLASAWWLRGHADVPWRVAAQALARSGSLGFARVSLPVGNRADRSSLSVIAGKCEVFDAKVLNETTLATLAGIADDRPRVFTLDYPSKQFEGASRVVACSRHGHQVYVAWARAPQPELPFD